MSVRLNIEVKNFPTGDVEIFRIDEENTCTITGETLEGGLMLHENLVLK